MENGTWIKDPISYGLGGSSSGEKYIRSTDMEGNIVRTDMMEIEKLRD